MTDRLICHQTAIASNNRYVSYALNLATNPFKLGLVGLGLGLGTLEVATYVRYYFKSIRAPLRGASQFRMLCSTL